MKRKTLDTLMTISCGGLAVGGLILLLTSIFGGIKDQLALNTALAAIFLANLFNLIRVQRNRREEEKNNAVGEQEEERHE